MTSRNTVWNHRARVALYKEIAKKFGDFDRKTWLVNQRGKDLVTSGEPNSISTLQSKKIYEGIYKTLTGKRNSKRFEDRIPTSWEALRNQVAWGLSRQKSQDLGQQRKKNLNRFAAVDAGFMSPEDAAWLEETVF